MKLQRDSIINLFIGVVLIALLSLLAALQYRWLGELSEGRREQMRAHLIAAANRVSRNFDMELTKTIAAFYSPSTPLDDEKVFTEKYQNWAEATLDENLLKSIYFAKVSDTDELRLRSFDRTAKQFTDLAWPAELAGLHQDLDKRLAHFRKMVSRQGDNKEPSAPPLPYNTELPAFIFPVFEFTENPGDSLPNISSYVIFQLDLNYLQQELLPTIVKREFVSDDFANYDIAVVTHNEKRNSIWQSVNGAAPLPEKVDANAPLFGILPDEFRKLTRNRSDNRSGSRPRGMGFFLPRSDEKGWDLLIRHRSGSLEAAVAQVRRRNLFVSFSIFGLLVASVILLTLTSRRAKKLAQQQMDFVAGVSHELRTPLSVIDSAAYNLTKGVIKDQTQMERYGKLIRKETSRLKDMIEQMLEFAGVQSGRQKYELQKVDVNSLIENVLNATHPLIVEGNFNIEKNVPQQLPAVMADAPAIERALQNLLSNAMKYGGEDRWIGINAKAVTNGHGPEVQITVSDHGRGIADEEQQQIFEPFYRGNEVRAAQIHGNGLGLSLVKNIVRAHQGKIHVESQAGHGSTFIMSLPALSEEHAS